jgi:hypothetical protein
MPLLCHHGSSLLHVPSWIVLNALNYYLCDLFSLCVISSLCMISSLCVIYLQTCFLHLCALLPASFSSVTFSFFSFLPLLILTTWTLQLSTSSLNHFLAFSFFFLYFSFFFLPFLSIVHYDTSSMVHILHNSPSVWKDDHPCTVSTDSH